MRTSLVESHSHPRLCRCSIQQRQVERTTGNALDCMCRITAVVLKCQRASARMDHSSRHADCILENRLFKSSSSQCLQSTRADCKIDRSSSDLSAVTWVAAAFAKINIPSRASEIDRKQASCKSCADDDHTFRHWRECRTRCRSAHSAERFNQAPAIDEAGIERGRCNANDTWMAEIADDSARKQRIEKLSRGDWVAIDAER